MVQYEKNPKRLFKTELKNLNFEISLDAITKIRSHCLKNPTLRRDK